MHHFRKTHVLLLLLLFLAGLLYIGPIHQTAKAQQQSTESYSDNFSKDSGLWTLFWERIPKPNKPEYSINRPREQSGRSCFFQLSCLWLFHSFLQLLSGWGLFGGWVHNVLLQTKVYKYGRRWKSWLPNS